MKKDVKTPEIVVEETSEVGSESEYTYEYEDENDESPTVYEGDIGAIITVVSCSSGLLLQPI